MLMIVLSLASCEKPSVPVTGIILNSEALTLTVGEEFNLTATIIPSNATDKSVAWTSSNATIVSVTDGIVSANKAGEASVMATSLDGGLTAYCRVTVYPKSKLLEPLMNEILRYIDPSEKTYTYNDENHTPPIFKGPIALYKYIGPRRVLVSVSDHYNFYLEDATSNYFNAEVTPLVTIAPAPADSLKVFNAIVDFFKEVEAINSNDVPYLKYIDANTALGNFVYGSIKAVDMEFSGIRMRRADTYMNEKGFRYISTYDNAGLQYTVPDVNGYYDAFTNVIDLFLHFVGRGSLSPFLYSTDDDRYLMSNL